MKRFNTTAVCIPSKHYMVDLSERVAQIAKMVDAGEYFTINRARQYGKTTTLNALRIALQDSYDVVSLDFQGLGDASFRTEESFCSGFVKLILEESEYGQIELPVGIREAFLAFVTDGHEDKVLNDLLIALRSWCRASERPLVLMVDEVDTATNNQVFIDFLAGLRDAYIKRETKGMPAFQSVILAGVTDVKHLRSKIRDEDLHRVNSPWNIAADFDVDMSLSEEGICGMLEEYEADHETGMDAATLARQIRDYTAGYPFLVSRICQLIDEALVPKRFATPSEAWTEYGVDEAVRTILSESNTLFESLMGKLTNFPHLAGQLRRVLLHGETVPWLPYDEEQQQLSMYGFIRKDHNAIAVANRVFEMLLYNHFIGQSGRNEDLKQIAAASRPAFVTQDGRLDVPRIMAHFIRDHNRIHRDGGTRFLEEEGRERFLTYLSPIVNGAGTYSIEEQTRDRTRMDVVVHYLGRCYVIDLKIWHGGRHNRRAEEQIMGYMDHFGLSTGYLLSFNFNRSKRPGVERVRIGDKTLFEGTV
ncbi:MAG: AAA-like domain-containing protein [Coriobacteriales bacterium]|nr:AAA-like domain-containing protein [Coriobacteriales bacterium]